MASVFFFPLSLWFFPFDRTRQELMWLTETRPTSVPFSTTCDMANWSTIRSWLKKVLICFDSTQIWSWMHGFFFIYKPGESKEMLNNTVCLHTASRRVVSPWASLIASVSSPVNVETSTYKLPAHTWSVWKTLCKQAEKSEQFAKSNGEMIQILS